MSPEVLSFLGSLFVGILTFVGVVYSSNSTRKVYEAVNDEKLKSISLQIKSLEDKQDKHNGVIERMYASEKQQASIAKDIEALQENMGEIRQDILDIKHDMEKVKEDIHSLQVRETQLETQMGR